MTADGEKTAAAPRGGRGEPADKPVIGLAGGIGSGKSTVAAQFARLGCHVLDSDRHAHQALGQGEVIQALRQWWGEQVIAPDGRPDRRAIAARVFGQPAEVERLNRLIHPRVHELRRAEAAEFAARPEVIAFVLDTPLLFEAGVADECDAIVFVETPLALRQQRVRQSRGWDAEELARRQGHQMDLDEKRRRCGYVIRNDGEPAELADQVRQVLDDVLRKFAAARAPGGEKSAADEMK